MDALTEEKSAAYRFMAEHERIGKELEAANDQIKLLTNQNNQLFNRTMLQDDMIKRAEGERNTHLQHAVELSAQIQFLVSGCVRALQIAAKVRVASNLSAVEEPSAEDIKALERLLAARPKTPWDDGSQDQQTSDTEQTEENNEDIAPSAASLMLSETGFNPKLPT